jgi:hypothetical protein
MTSRSWEIRYLLQTARGAHRSMDLRTYVGLVALMMEAVRNFETSVSYNETTRRNIPEDSNLQMCFHSFLKL